MAEVIFGGRARKNEAARFAWSGKQRAQRKRIPLIQSGKASFWGDELKIVGLCAASVRMLKH